MANLMQKIVHFFCTIVYIYPKCFIIRNEIVFRIKSIGKIITFNKIKLSRIGNLQIHSLVFSANKLIHIAFAKSEYGYKIFMLHSNSVLDANVDMAAKKSDVTTFRGAFESVLRQHYPSLISHIAIRLVSCPSICTEGLGILSR